MFTRFDAGTSVAGQSIAAQRPQWRLSLPPGTLRIHTAHFGVQRHSPAEASLRAAAAASDAIATALSRAGAVVETVQVMAGHDMPGALVHIASWADAGDASVMPAEIDLLALHASLGDWRDSVGLWCERFTVASGRLDTAYWGPDPLRHRPGLAGLSQAGPVRVEPSLQRAAPHDPVDATATPVPDHSTNAAPGANAVTGSVASLPDSTGMASRPVHATETAPRPVHATETAPRPVHVTETAPRPVHATETAPRPVHATETAPRPFVLFDPASMPLVPIGYGESIAGVNPGPLLHVRFGHEGRDCGEAEAALRDGDLQRLMDLGLDHLWRHPAESGARGLRQIVRLAPDGRPVADSGLSGFLRGADDLDRWNHEHAQHLAAFRHLLDLEGLPPAARRLRGYSEVATLAPGDARFHYVNCGPRTGVIRFFDLERTRLRVRHDLR